MNGAWLKLLVPLLLLGQASCTVTAVSAKEDARPKNSCSSNEGCDDGERCLAGLCQALDPQLEAVLLTATPDFESSVPRLTFVTHLAELGASAKDVVWPGPAVVTGSLLLPDGGCYPEFISDDPDSAILASTDGSLPFSARLSLAQRLLGIPQQTYDAKTNTAPVKGYTFSLTVPSGEYDVYLVPPKRQRGACVVPPQLFRNVPIGVNENVAPNGEYRFKLAAVSELNLRISWPESAGSLTGWVADMIEPVGGNPISTEVVLGDPLPGRQGRVDYSVPLAFSAVTEPSGSSSANLAKELVRLRPPAALVAPTIYLERSALGLLQDASVPVNVTSFTRYPPPAAAFGKLVRKEDGRPVAGVLSFASKSIYGVDSGVLASFRTTVEVQADGAIEVLLPPGRYTVQATPRITSGVLENTLSMGEAEWEVAADVQQQFGRLLELSPSSALSGQSRVEGAQAQADPVPLVAPPFRELFGTPLSVPRPAGALADSGGRFVLKVDDLQQSRVNVSVQAPEELGFGWFVRPGLELGLGDQDLGRVSLPLPSVLSGQASVQEASGASPLGYATIRAYAYLDASYRYTPDPSEAATVVQVAETRADEEGRFRLLLPATIDAPK